jgi:hypothetical protein
MRQVVFASFILVPAPVREAPSYGYGAAAISS